MAKRRRHKASAAVVLADVPERVELRSVQAELEARRDAIAATDLEIENLREQLAEFEASYHARLAPEHRALAQVEGVVRHIERWVDLLRAPSKVPQKARQARQLERHRHRELGRQRSELPPGETDDPDANVPVQQRGDRLKAAYRALARRYHPDLARTEEERLQASEMMSRINALYRLGDVARLEVLAEQAQGAEIADPELDVSAQLDLLRQRLAWFDTVLDNLQDERVALEGSATCEMWRNVEQAEAQGHDIFAELKGQLQRRVARAYNDVGAAIELLETEVARFNKRAALTEQKGQGALERVFDPYSDKRLIRLGLEQLGTSNVSMAAQGRVDELEHLAADAPPLLRLILFTHVYELSPFPLEGLETYDDLKLRFDALRTHDHPVVSLEEALVQTDAWLEYGVKRATSKVVHMGLRFRDPSLREAVPVALQQLTVRRAFREVLGVLGEKTRCSACKRDTFAVPLYKSRGLDDLRASVCPACGHILKSYWMAAGKDVQAVLNATFLDYEIISEWTFKLSRASVAMQLVPQQVEKLKVGDLKARLVTDLFARYDVEVDGEHVQLWQGDKQMSERKRLRDLDERRFSVRFSADAPVSEADALELVRHRIRNRFR